VALSSIIDFIGKRRGGKIKIRRGFDIAVVGTPSQQIFDGPEISEVGLLATDYPGVHIDMRVGAGDRVALGDVVFADRRRPAIKITAPGGGIVTEVIARDWRSGAHACVIRLDGDAAKEFDVSGVASDRVRAQALLLDSGLWSGLTERPFGRIPDPGTVPAAIFVTAVDTHPLAADPQVVISAARDAFDVGLGVLRTLTDGPVHLCQGPGPKLTPDAVIFDGPHPAGLPGTHIHHLHGTGSPVWHLDYQDTVAIGRLFTTGTLPVERVVALAGPGVRAPRLLRTRVGASLDELTRDQLVDGDLRIISGSVLAGRQDRYLGRHHLQVSVLFEGWDRRHQRSWLSRRSTDQNGAAGPVIPTAAMDRALGPDIPAVPLARALMAGDGETARRLGCLELVEDDVALMAFACPGKSDYGAALRAILNVAEANQ